MDTANINTNYLYDILLGKAILYGNSLIPTAQTRTMDVCYIYLIVIWDIIDRKRSHDKNSGIHVITITYKLKSHKL